MFLLVQIDEGIKNLKMKMFYNAKVHLPNAKVKTLAFSFGRDNEFEE